MVAEVVRADLTEMPHSAIAGIGDPIVKLVERLLTDPYFELISSTPGVYERQCAPPGKFLPESLSHTLALFRVSALNTSRRAILEVEEILDDAALKAHCRELRASETKVVSISVVDSSVGSIQTGANSVMNISKSDY